MKKLIIVLCLMLGLILLSSCFEKEEIVLVDVVVVDQYEKEIVINGKATTKYYVEVKKADQLEVVNARTYIVEIDYEYDIISMFEYDFENGKELSVNEKDLKEKK